MEIRALHTKIDELVTHQWQRLLEIQQLQMDMMDEMMNHHQWVREALNVTPVTEEETEKTPEGTAP